MERYVKLDQQFTKTPVAGLPTPSRTKIAHSLGLEDRVLDQSSTRCQVANGVALNLPECSSHRC